MKPIQLLAAMAISTGAVADSYNIYFPNTMPGMVSSAGNIYIVNTDSRVVSTVDSTEYISSYGAAANTFGDNDYVVVDGTSLNAAGGAGGRVFQDFKGSVLTIRENRILQVRDKGADGIETTPDDGENRAYDRIIELNVQTGEVVSRTLVASSIADYEYAVENGYETVLELKSASADTLSGMEIFSMTTYSANVTNIDVADTAVETSGNFSTNKITAADGSSLFRQEADGTVHIGEKSIVLADELVSNSGYDQIYSSSGILELGNNAAHRTIVTGTLEIMDPSLPSHAATKRYADGGDAMSQALAMMPKAMPGESMVTAGVASSGGQGAIAIGLSARNVASGMSYNFGSAYNDTVREVSFAAGVGWAF
jgi:hypothetical protein